MSLTLPSLEKHESVQQFGFLLIANSALELIGISEKVFNFIAPPRDFVLGTPLGDALYTLFDEFGKKLYITAQKLLKEESPRQLLTATFNDETYYFQICRYKDHILLEWEKQLESHIDSAQMNEIVFLFEYQYKHNWNLLCTAINNLLGYDRVFVLQVDETGYSKVVAENTRGGFPMLNKTDFSHQFMPREVIPYYASATYRYIPNVNTFNQTFYYREEASETLSISKIFPLPTLHEKYIKTLGLTSAIFFPLKIHGRFWGMVIAHNKNEKQVDQQKRKLCTFIIQNAVSKYENLLKQGLLDVNNQISNIELELKEQLHTNRTVNCALVQSLDILVEGTKSGGVAIYNQGDLFFKGNCPKHAQFLELVHFLQKHTKKTIFKDHNFRLRHADKFKDDLPFAGLMALNISDSNDHYVVWFRPEVPSSVVELNADSCLTNEASTTDLLQMYEKTVFDSAIPWNDQEIYFVQSLHRIINESIVRKAKEKQLLTEELLSLNNELEMFTFTLSHDLKNPLSVLKMGLQFLSGPSAPATKDRLEPWYKNLLGSIESIEDIINNMVRLSTSKTGLFVKDPIPMAYTIRKLVNEALLLYDNPRCQVHFGPLLPLWGEKSAIYQVFLNLIGNAVKYTSGSDEPQVWISSYQQNQNICYVFKDNGIGIPSDNLPHVFDMFMRAENALNFKGTGVGLSLVKRIVERLGGDIKIASELAQGTEITLCIPIAGDFPESMLFIDN